MRLERWKIICRYLITMMSSSDSADFSSAGAPPSATGSESNGLQLAQEVGALGALRWKEITLTREDFAALNSKLSPVGTPEGGGMAATPQNAPPSKLFFPVAIALFYVVMMWKDALTLPTLIVNVLKTLMGIITFYVIATDQTLGQQYGLSYTLQLVFAGVCAGLLVAASVASSD